ncbi:succinate semialdehyde dehydrogenase [Mycena olivaceomarginata]|nr:succinate semialdehyde dehydrogenase [Mycena olivaceomarginata]
MADPAIAQTTISPIDLLPPLDASIVRAAAAQKEWAAVPLAERIAIGQKFIDEFTTMGERGAGEMRGFLERARYMLSIAESNLSDIPLEDTDKPGFRRFIKRVPLGVVLVIAPWNFPYLTAINSVFPAIIAGNAVLYKPSPQTPLSAERFSLGLHRAGVPRDVVIPLHLNPELTKQVIQHPLVAGGRTVEEAAVSAPGFKGVALELDADLDYTATELVDGAMFNSGQSCCAVERIYVHESVFDDFVSKAVEIVKKYKLGDPNRSDTTLGPVVSLASAERIRKQVADAVAAGAKALVPPNLFRAAKPDTCYVAPQILVDVNHTMDIMMEETFGPVVGIQKVESDEEAVKLMNDSPYGLTASIWTNAAEHPESEEVFLNSRTSSSVGRCDYLDPALAWTGVKNSGRGVSLSKFGYDQLTRPKNVHMKIKTA